jgi:hypothetical protein
MYGSLLAHVISGIRVEQLKECLFVDVIIKIAPDDPYMVHELCFLSLQVQICNKIREYVFDGIVSRLFRVPPSGIQFESSHVF